MSRRILLVIDYAGCHYVNKRILNHLTKIKIEFLPPNTTSMF